MTDPEHLAAQVRRDYERREYDLFLRAASGDIATHLEMLRELAVLDFKYCVAVCDHDPCGTADLTSQSQEFVRTGMELGSQLRDTAWEWLQARQDLTEPDILRQLLG